MTSEHRLFDPDERSMCIESEWDQVGLDINGDDGYDGDGVGADLTVFSVSELSGEV